MYNPSLETLELRNMPSPNKQQRSRAGRKPYLDSLITNIVQGAEGAGLKDDSIRRLILAAIQNDARIGGKMGRTLAEAIDMCAAALNTAGIPTPREDIIRILAEPPRKKHK